MVGVGIRELKEKLGSYVLKVKHGETIVVTDHGKEVAILGPISPERVIAMQLVSGAGGSVCASVPGAPGRSGSEPVPMWPILDNPLACPENHGDWNIRSNQGGA